jgi:Ca2+-binding EF-hand superfamily protein
MRGQDLSLGAVFTILDTNVSNQITFSEFRSHLHRMDTKLDDEEIMALFKSIDVNNDQAITYDELIEKFSYFNTQQLLKRISVFIMSGKSNADFIFDKYAKDSARGRMALADFGLMVKDFVKRITQAEILQMFKHFDRGGKSYVTRQDFTTAFSTEVKDAGFSITIEDIIKPLATKLKRFKYTTGELFDKADKNHNFHISAQELADAVVSTSSGETKLDASEVKMINDYFYNRFNKTQITRAEFIELFETKFSNKSDEAEARKAQIAIKEKCKNAVIDVRKHIWDFNPEKTEKLTLRNFKRAINELKCLTLYQIDNLAKYLDDQNEGFVSIDKFVAGVKNSVTFADSFGRSSPSRKS